jgi:fused signal recognition particle receptor
MFSFFKKKPKPTDTTTEVLLAVEPPATAISRPTQLDNVVSPKGLPSRFSAAPAIRADVTTALAIDSTTKTLITPASELPQAVDQVATSPYLNDDSRNERLVASDIDGMIVSEPIPEEKKRTWIARLKVGLSKTSSNLTTLFVGAKIGEELYEELESALLMSDAGVDATQHLLDALRKKVKNEKLTDTIEVKAALRTLLISLLAPLQKPLVLDRYQPLVMMVAGVNGAGKTTTIGKLAKHLQAHQQSVLLAAGDTFRAAAREQLTIWGERNNVSVISQQSGDPAAVAFDAVHSAQARGTNVVMIDTAGRLPTQLHLMEELKKIKRVVTKGMSTAPHEVLLIIDGNTGQNALAQVKAFDDALGLTGLVVTKLDGTAKGGVLAAIAKSRPVPVYFIGVGEQIEDLQPFNAEEFADALLG